MAISKSPNKAAQRQSNDPKSASTFFDIDKYLNPYIPRSPIHLLPKSISYFLGHRRPRDTTHPPKPTLFEKYHNTIIYTSIFIGTFCGLSIIENVFLALPPLSGHAVPIIIASFGAAAILEYNSIESPLAQPRNLILGHFVSALVAVGITKLFEHLAPQRFEDLRWLAGALSVGAASILMSATKTIHPPAGATALLAATEIEIRLLGWWLLPLVLLASMLMLTSALLLNNAAGRRYPVYWWTPVDLAALRAERRQRGLGSNLDSGKTRDAGHGADPKADDDVDIEKFADAQSASTSPPTQLVKDERLQDTDDDDDTQAGSQTGDLSQLSTQETRMELSSSVSHSSVVATRTASHTSTGPNDLSATPTATGPESKSDDKPSIVPEWTRPGRILVSENQTREEKIIISTTDGIVVPRWLELNEWEDEVLHILLERLKVS